MHTKMFSYGASGFLFDSLVTGKTEICSLPLGLLGAGLRVCVSPRVCCIYQRDYWAYHSPLTERKYEPKLVNDRKIVKGQHRV